jgi:hypothetical protein
MEKKINMPIKEYLCRQLSTQMMIPENVILSVINHQFDGALQAMKTQGSVEISGWGTFRFNMKKAKKFSAYYSSLITQHKKTLLEEELSPILRKKTEDLLEHAERHYNEIEIKLNKE